MKEEGQQCCSRPCWQKCCYWKARNQGGGTESKKRRAADSCMNFKNRSRAAAGSHKPCVNLKNLGTHCSLKHDAAMSWDSVGYLLCRRRSVSRSDSSSNAAVSSEHRPYRWLLALPLLTGQSSVASRSTGPLRGIMMVYLSANPSTRGSPGTLGS